MKKIIVRCLVISVLVFLYGCQSGGEVSQVVTMPPGLPENISTRVAEEVVQETVNDNLMQNLKKHFSGLADEQIKDLQLINGISFDGATTKIIRIQFFYSSDQSRFSYSLDKDKAIQIVAFVSAEIKNRLEKKLIEQGYASTIKQVNLSEAVSAFGVSSEYFSLRHKLGAVK
ncbi:MAG: hypothetical protein ACRERV_01735 [Methylococcales bacterium]